jgi:hypothetical protein
MKARRRKKNRRATGRQRKPSLPPTIEPFRSPGLFVPLPPELKEALRQAAEALKPLKEPLAAFQSTPHWLALQAQMKRLHEQRQVKERAALEQARVAAERQARKAARKGVGGAHRKMSPEMIEAAQKKCRGILSRKPRPKQDVIADELKTWISTSRWKGVTVSVSTLKAYVIRPIFQRQLSF